MVSSTGIYQPVAVKSASALTERSTTIQYLSKFDGLAAMGSDGLVPQEPTDHRAQRLMWKPFNVNEVRFDVEWMGRANDYGGNIRPMTL